MIANGIREVTTTTGTGTVALSAAVGFARFSDAFSVSDTVEYAISDGNNWEWGTGTVGAGNTLARTTVHSSLVGGVYTTIGATAINLSGSAAVICTITAEEYLGHQADATAHNIPGSIAAAIGGLGNAAALNVGTTTGTVAAGDDARFSGAVTGGDSHDHAGGDGAQIAYSTLSGLPTLGTAAAAATGDFEAAGAVSTHNAASGAHGISAWGATLVDDANVSAARSTLGLGSVDNTSDAGKPVSTAQQTALNLKADIASPTFTGTVSGITAAMVGAPAGSGSSSGTNTGDSATPAETTTSLGTLLNGATSKTTPVDADQIGLMDSAASNILKKLSWANLKTALSSIFVLLAGKAGGQTITGGTSASENLTLASTSHTTKGKILLGSVSAYDSVNDRLGVGTITPASSFHVSGNSSGSTIEVARYTNAGSGANTKALIAFTAGSVSYGTISGGYGLTPEIEFNLPTATQGAFVWKHISVETMRLSAIGLAIGTTTPSAKIHAVSTTEQLRCGYDAANYCKSLVNSVGVSRVDLVGTAPEIIHAVSDATTNAVYNVSTLSKNSTGAGAAGLGVRQVLAAKSSTTTDVPQAGLSSEWLVATHATRAVRGEFGGWDYSGYRAGFRFEADGTQIKTSVNGVPAAARAAALTAEIPGDATRDELRLTELYNACKNFGIIN